MVPLSSNKLVPHVVPSLILLSSQDADPPAPRELTASETKEYVDKAGSDGVEIHGANVHLIDEYKT